MTQPDPALRPRRLGMLVPSSNIVLEPATARLLPADGSVTCHVSRLRVLAIAPDAASDSQFDPARVLAAAALLADARADLILWNGTSSSWLGFEQDRRLVDAIAQATGIPATTAVIALNRRLASLGARRVAWVTPYVADVEAGIVRNYAAIGLDTVAAERLDLTDNFAFGEVPPARVAAMIRSVARQRPDAIVVMCTNLAGAAVADPLSAELGIPVLDSVVEAVRHSLELLRDPLSRADAA